MTKRMQRPVRPADRADDDIEFVVRQYSDIVYRICLVILGNQQDAEDALQETHDALLHEKARNDNHRRELSEGLADSCGL